METLIAVVHIIVALALIILVVIQDSKSGSLGIGFGGGGSNSVLGATGATTLAQKATRFSAVIFAATCIALSMYSARTNRSVIDGTVTNSAAPVTAPAVPAATTTEPAAAAAPAAQPVTPAAPATGN